jgi:hypothetical protein
MSSEIETFLCWPTNRHSSIIVTPLLMRGSRYIHLVSFL